MTVSGFTALLRQKFETAVRVGFQNEKDEYRQKYIMLSNMVAYINLVTACLQAPFLWFFADNAIGGFTSFLIGCSFILAVYFNAKGFNLLSKFYMMVVANIGILACCCIFSHEGLLVYYYFPIILVSIFLFPYTERKWLFTSVLLSLSCFIAESTNLRQYLPSYNLIEDMTKNNIVLLGGNIVIIIMDIFALLYIVQQRDNHLMAIQNKLVVQNEDIQTFSIAASHSLLTPIYVSTFFLDKIKETPMPAHSKSISMIETCLNQMDQLVSSLFSYNNIIKIEENKSDFYALHEIIFIKKRMEAKFTGSSIVLPEKDIYISTNLILFTIIMQNLIDNGLKYNISPQPVVSIQFERAENIVSFFVSDNGIGIDKKNFDKIFEPFKRINTKGRFKGNGLGLSGAKRAAERIGGRLTCRDSSQSGSVFQLDIPFYQQ